ncbi:MAG: ABC transporter substrate-binding protein, partial [Ruminococcus sp.]|nr:ABC transporter substrate-binding protein [Ruminococcus sp.]
AEQFLVYSLDNGIYEINIADGQKFLLVPEGTAEPQADSDVTVIHQPVKNLYVAASSSIDLFDGIGVLDEVKMTSTKRSDWSLPAVQNALESGNMIYVGKYSTPDYETVISENCGLALESTMIYHSPETKEQLESLGIPVMVERSSYESHPLGRLEWIKLYGLIMGREKEAENFFNEKMKIFGEVSANTDIPEDERQTVAFFYITANGYANVRKPDDYISKMIDLAGGRYIFTDDDLNTEENALSTMNMDIESFYQKAKDADFIIYNSTIDGEFENISQLIEKNELLSDFRAVKNNNVWCTEKNTFQQTTGASEMIHDIHMIVTGQAEDMEQLEFLHRLK